MCELLIAITGTVIGGLLLTFCLFLLNERLFTKYNLTGEWVTKTTIQGTTYGLYKDLRIEYKIHLLQKGYELIGSGEKIRDIHKDGSITEFEFAKRVIVHVDGYYERKYFRKSKIYLIIHEEGKGRETRATYLLTIINSKKLTGTFKSTAANTEGIVEMVTS